MTEEELVGILRREEQRANNWQMEHTRTRTGALAAYNREPRGDEEVGQSSVVTSEFADTVESMLPGFIEVFVSGEDIVEFAPMERADEAAAKEANLYVPHVFMRENDGFRITYWWLKDALMSRLGAVIVDVEEVVKAHEDRIEGWTPEQVMLAPQVLLQARPNAEDIEVEAEPDPSTGLMNGTISYKCKKKRVVVDNVAPEDFLCSPRARDIDAASYKGYRKEVTSSELRIMGMKQADIDELSSDRVISSEEDQRQANQGDEDRTGSERTLWIVVAYVRADDNGDGISEMLRVVYAHAGGQVAKIIEKMEWEEPEAPIAPATPILMPHQLVGKSLFDQTQDLQEVGTTLTRGMLDNIYLTNRPRPAINARVSVSSVIDWVPGMPITVEGNDNPANSVSWLQIPSIIAPALSALEYLATQRESRTGATRMGGQGMDASTYNKTATGAQILMTAAQQRQVLIARTFAQTAFTRLMRLIYRAIKRAADGPQSFYANDSWQTADPTKWPDDMHLVASVGMGSGNKQMQLQNLMMIGAGQEKLVLAQGGPDGPLVKPEHMANTMRKMVEAAGFRATEQFVASERELQSAPPKEPQQDPEMAKIQAQHAAAMAKQQSDAALGQAKLQADIALEQQRNAAQLQAMREKAALDLQLKREQAMVDMDLAREKAALDAQLKREELAMEAALGKYEIDNAPKPPPGAASLKEQQVSQ